MTLSDKLISVNKLLLILLFLPFYSSAGIIVINGLTHTHEVVPNETYRGEIEIQNTGNSAQAVKLYQKDYSFNYKDEAYYEAPGTNVRSNAMWMDISPTYTVLQPKEKRLISYEVKTPDRQDLVGTFWSVIMVEGETPIDSSLLKSGMTINTKVRYAIQIVTTFNKPGERNLSFMNATFESAEIDQHYLSIDIENTGQFLFRPDVSIELFDDKGEAAGVFQSNKKKIYPNTSTRFKVGMEGIKPGKYQALVLADCGGEDVFGINLDVEISDD